MAEKRKKRRKPAKMKTEAMAAWRMQASYESAKSAISGGVALSGMAWLGICGGVGWRRRRENSEWLAA